MTKEQEFTTEQIDQIEAIYGSLYDLIGLMTDEEPRIPIVTEAADVLAEYLHKATGSRVHFPTRIEESDGAVTVSDYYYEEA